MPNYVVNLLLQLQEQAEPNCPFVFLDKTRWERVQQKWFRFQEQGIDRKWTNKELHGNLLRQFQRTCKRAGIVSTDKLTVHCMRKSWACNLVDASVPIHTLMKLGGWSSIETCQQFYLQSTDENEKKAIRELEKLVSVGWLDLTGAYLKETVQRSPFCVLWLLTWNELSAHSEPTHNQLRRGISKTLVWR